MRLFLIPLVAVFSCACTHAQNEQSASSAEEVVTDFYEYLRAGDIDAMDPLFFKIPIMESNRADWLALLARVSQKVADEQLDWEVVCGKELMEMAAVIVNQTMKRGRKHADPDAIYLIRENDRWMLSLDMISPNASDEIRSVLSNSQLSERSTLERWAISEIRGITTECSDRD